MRQKVPLSGHSAQKRTPSVGGMGSTGGGSNVPQGDYAVPGGWDFVYQIDCEPLHKVSQAIEHPRRGGGFVSKGQTALDRPAATTIPA